jgi:uncharacterized protein YlzI (FlbEa/FlbD family)
MFITLTDMSGKKLAINVAQIKMIEPDVSGGCHIVLNADMGRVVTESYEAILAVIGLVKP